MQNNLSLAQIEAVFVAMDLPLIERGIDEIQADKDRLTGVEPNPADRSAISEQLIISNGTGEQSGNKNKNAKLERRTFRT
jgi:hypothetical protein